MESAALAVWQALACQIQTTIPKLQISNLQISNPLKSPPSAPAHSARQPTNMHPPGFCDFQKTLAIAERAANKLSTTDLDLNLHQKCNFKDGFSMKYVLSCILSSYFYKNVLLARATSTFLKTDAKQKAFNNVSFESLWGALALSIPLRWALSRH